MTRLPLTPQTLAHVAGHIWGSYGWQDALAVEFEKNPRTVRRWYEGTRGIPPTLWPWLRNRLVEHSAEARALAQQLPTQPTMEEANGEA